MTLSFDEIAFNQAPDSQNQIHSDDMAQRYGFRGGLVPGVTLSAYLTQPGVVQWGLSFLQRGQASIKVLRPIYHAERVSVSVNLTSETSYEAELINSEGEVRAIAKVSLPEQADLPALPYRKSLPVMADNYQPAIATPEVFENLQHNGTLETRYLWSKRHAMASYFDTPKSMPALLTFGDAPAPNRGLANTSFILGCANWVFASNAGMNPWVHLQTDHQLFAEIKNETEVAAQMSVDALFEKKGHQFADIWVNLFNAETSEPLARIWQRAIYRLRA